MGNGGLPPTHTHTDVFPKYKWDIFQNRHMSDHKTTIIKCKVEIIPSKFSNHDGIKLETNNRKKSGKYTTMGKLNNTLLSKQWLKEEIKGKI